MLENSIFSILSPEGFASILWKDSSRWEEAAEVMKLTASDLLALGVCDSVIPEKDGGAHEDRNAVFHRVSRELERYLESLTKRSTASLVKERYRKLRNIGNLKRKAE